MRVRQRGFPPCGRRSDSATGLCGPAGSGVRRLCAAGGGGAAAGGNDADRAAGRRRGSRQDTLLRAYRAIDRFDGKHPRAWLLTIMRRAEINRHRRRRPHLLDDPDADLDRLSSTGPSGSAEEIVVGEAFDEVVDEALGALPDKHRQVVQLVDIDGLTYAEAAHLLDVPEGTVMSRLHRARKRIRARLATAGLAPKRGVM